MQITENFLHEVTAATARRRQMAMLHGAPSDGRALKKRALGGVSYRTFIIPAGALKPLTRIDAQSIILSTGMALGFVGFSKKEGFYEIQPKGEDDDVSR